eukprot:403341522
MGCKFSNDSSAKKQLNVNERWRLLKLPEIDSSKFENEFEMMLFKTMCLVRADPEYILPFIEKAKNNQHYTGANIELVINILKNLKGVPMLKISESGNLACRKVNEDMKDMEFPNCYRIRKVYRDMFQKDNPKNAYYEMTSGCGGTGGVRRSILGELDCELVREKSQINSNQQSEIETNTPGAQLNDQPFVKFDDLKNNKADQKQITDGIQSHSAFSQHTQNQGNLVELDQNYKDEPVYEYTEIGWEGTAEELALFILIGGCQCSGDDSMPMIDRKVTSIGVSFRAHRTLKSSLQLIYLSEWNQDEECQQNQKARQNSMM